MTFKVKTTAAGLRNVSVEISGWLPRDDRFSLIASNHPALKITSFLFLIQEKAGLYLWWDKEGNDLILPLESRGAFKLEVGIKSPEGWDGVIWAQAFKTDQEDKAFLLLMDFDK